MAKWIFVASLFFMVTVQPCYGSGRVEIKMLRYQSSCTDNSFLRHQCDTYFKLCLDKPGPLDINDCFYRTFGPSRHYENTNSMEFQDNIGGISNPLVIPLTNFKAKQFMFVVEAIDDEAVQSDEHLVTLGKTVTIDPNKEEWSNDYMQSGSYHVWFQYRGYCDAHYYTTNCDVYCKARDDEQGHYTCDTSTGLKRCMAGWKGDNCSTDINECERRQCYNNAKCNNLPGSYSCICPNGFTGQNCDLINSLCHSTPCQNNGTCVGNMTDYNCTCSFEWTGSNCETQVDFCETNPCHNGALCYGSVGNYTCACQNGWSGQTCSIEVDACESAPCQNGGTCQKMPQGEYQCYCSPEYENKSCEALKKPCDPNPCQNSGTCTEMSYDVYNCTCVFGWDGANCENYIKVNTEQQRDQEHSQEDKGVDWLPIVIAVVSAFVIIVFLLILFFFIRRRRQKKSLQVFLTQGEHRNGEVVQVLDRGNLAFQNAIYDETNRANANTDRQQRPLPSPSAEMKPSKLPDEELGAVGGANPYHDIDTYAEPNKLGKNVTKDTQQKCLVGLDTRSRAGDVGENERGYANTYADFEQLKRNSVAARVATGLHSDQTYPDPLELVEEREDNHYHQLDEVNLAFRNDDQDIPPAAAPSHYDVLPRRASDVTPNDVTPREMTLTGGYMDMNGAISRAENRDSEGSTDDDEDDQEDIKQLRREVLEKSVNQVVS